MLVLTTLEKASNICKFRKPRLDLHFVFFFKLFQLSRLFSRAQTERRGRTTGGRETRRVPSNTMICISVLSLLGLLPYTLGAPHPAATTPPLTSAPALTIPTNLPHTPYSGTPTVSGAVNASSIGSGIASSASINPVATTYPSDGRLHDTQPGPYIPAGGIGTNGSIPVYNAKSDFDFESLV